MKSSALDVLESGVSPDEFAVATRKFGELHKEAFEVLVSVRGALGRFREEFGGLGDEDERKRGGVKGVGEVEGIAAEVRGEVDGLAGEIRYL